MIYYGDEVGMTGGEDPDCRKSMVWQQERHTKSLLVYYRELIALRKQHSALRNGEFHLWTAEQSYNVIGYIRRNSMERLGVLINNSPNTNGIKLDVPEELGALRVKMVFGTNDISLLGNRLSCQPAPYSASIMVLS